MEENTKELTLPTIRDAGTAEDERLVQACLSGDEKAWNTLIDKYKRLIYSVPVKYGFSPDDAGDIFQNVCVDLFTNLSKVRKIESLRSWLITVATHKCFHWKKQQRGEVELDAMEQELAEEIEAAPMVLQEVEEEQAVRDAILRLTPRCAELVRRNCPRRCRRKTLLEPEGWRPGECRQHSPRQHGSAGWPGCGAPIGCRSVV